MLTLLGSPQEPYPPTPSARASSSSSSPALSVQRPVRWQRTIERGRAAIKLPIKVVPGSSRNGTAGWLGERLKVRVSAPPERGRANAAVEATIAEALGVSSECVRVVAGKSSSRKLVEVVGLPEAEVYRRLSKEG